MLIGFLLALGCSVCYGSASVLQAHATRSVESGSGSGIDPALLIRAGRQWRYLAGIGLDCLGFLLQVAALRMVPIYVVAAALAASIAVTGIVSAWLLSAHLSQAEWTAVRRRLRESFRACLRGRTWALPACPRRAGLGAVGVAAAVFIVGAAAGRLPDRKRALALGLGSGTGFGVVEVGVRLLDEIDPTKRAFYTNPALYAAAAGGAAGFAIAHVRITTSIGHHHRGRHGCR